MKFHGEFWQGMQSLIFDRTEVGLDCSGGRSAYSSHQREVERLGRELRGADEAAWRELWDRIETEQGAAEQIITEACYLQGMHDALALLLLLKNFGERSAAKSQ